MTASAGVIGLRTPDGVPLPFRVAPAGLRALAFLIDGLVLLLTVVLLSLIGSLAAITLGELDGAGLGFAFLNLLIFVVINFYFVLFELRLRGQTPGKRAMGLRVVARDGGPLTASMVLARNLTRDLELLFPLLIAASGGTFLGFSSGWLRLAAVAWTLVVLFLPLMNRERLRIGDLVGGTLVVRAPEAPLLPDLVATHHAARAAGAPTYTFTDAQLDLYGIRELHVLEQLLRRGPGRWNPAVMADVAQRIRERIAWPDAPEQRFEPIAFLHAFYAAQRARLEGRLLLGDRREARVSTPNPHEVATKTPHNAG